MRSDDHLRADPRRLTGAWCWQRLTPALRAAGHTVFTPTLTGLGERAHLLNPDVGLETHVQDVLATLFYEDLTEVVLPSAPFTPPQDLAGALLDLA